MWLRARELRLAARDQRLRARVVDLGRALEVVVAAVAADDEHAPVEQRRGGVVIARACMLAPRDQVFVARVVDLGAAQLGVAGGQPAGHEHAAVGQQRGGVVGARAQQLAGGRPGDRRRIELLRGGDVAVADVRPARDEHAAVGEQRRGVREAGGMAIGNVVLPALGGGVEELGGGLDPAKLKPPLTSTRPSVRAVASVEVAAGQQRDAADQCPAAACAGATATTPRSSSARPARQAAATPS